VFARLLAWWNGVADSLWALPLAIAAAGGACALAALNIELPWTSQIAWLYAGGAEQAPEFAASLVGAMITLTALAFSITMVVLTLAAQQLGPRLIQLFMKDRGTQASLGLFLATIVYLLLVLRALDGSDEGTAPSLAITGGTALVLASVVTLLIFVHALARSIVADHVIARVGEALDDELERAFPAHTAGREHAPPAGEHALELGTRGYVQYINYEGLVRDLSGCDGQIVLAYSAGDHIIHGEVDAWGHGADHEKLLRALRSVVIISSQRTSDQDPEWSVRQLVEIGLRALSPGINDEFTALAVIDRLTLSLSVLVTRDQEAGVWSDKEGYPRVFGPTPSIAGILESAFEQLRESGSSKHYVLERIATSLMRLAAIARPTNRPPLEQQISNLRALAQGSSLEPNAKQRILRALAPRELQTRAAAKQEAK
jgi:uncharacterized membrane protein